MKVHKRVVIKIETMEVVSDDFYYHSGNVALCKGGGSSGKVDYPSYMKEVHSDWLNNSGSDTIESSVTDVMNAALGASPYTALTAYNPDTPLSTMEGFVSDLDSLVDLLSSNTGLDSLIASILSPTRVNDEITAYAAIIDDQIETTVLPRFEAGMRDINAVMSSAFVVGRAVIEASRNREVAKYASAVRMKFFGEDALEVVKLKLNAQNELSRLGVETQRMKIVAKKEQYDANREIAVEDAKWDLEVFKYGGNLLASIGGGTVGAAKAGSTVGSALGGALSGAAAGAMIGPMVSGATAAGPIGAAIGGIIGLATAFL